MALPATYDLAVAAELAPVQSALGILPRSRNLVALIGDSRKEQAFADSQSNGTTKCNWNHVGWAAALSGQRFRVVYNGGKSGERTDQFFARLPNVIASSAGVCLWQGGLNGIAQNSYTHAVSGAAITSANIVVSIISDAQQQVDALLAANIRVVLFLDPGSSNLNAAQIGRLNQLNEGLRSLAESRMGVYLFDLPAIQRDQATTGSAIAFKAGYMRNEAGIYTHENVPGAYYAGKALASLISTFIPPLPLNYVDNADQPTANSLTQLVNNPIFSTTTGGTAQAGAGTISGSVPGSWKANITSGAASLTLSTGPNPVGPGNELVIAYTTAAAGNQFRVEQDAALANWSQGDILQMCSEVVVDAGSTGLAGVYNNLLANGDSTSITAADLYTDANHGSVPSEAMALNLQTPKLVIPQWTAKGYVACYPLWVVASGAGSGTIRVRSAALRKRAS